ncbi:hypothetical protein PMNALOAF_0180 [Methylobacterium adhaesivum]|uniref:GntR family transcriptional regulator n=1 Tax=Methylobacterium adhaesivum TaxID=333297 RepID=A0ABT8BCV8_9HYPH|nr:hypothetical protein [Methylobacterium adhaesivum]MDN3589887.1 hypothetical protein [Methylobacterium adhaesivum]GJD28948.1 hypothetical protein PMNALOAF_0180 [Methylobacterium adhaesivum]
MDRTDPTTRHSGDLRLQRSVADTLRVIAAACAEREAPPVKAARQELAAIYGATRLTRRREGLRAAG